MKPNQVAELKRISEENDGLLSPDAVVKAARNEKNPLHSCFEWNQDKAAHEHRLHQARKIIKFVVEYLPGASEPINTFVSLKKDRNPAAGYRLTIDVLNDKERREQLLLQALDELRAFEKKYRTLTELAEVFAKMRSVEARHRKQAKT